MNIKDFAAASGLNASQITQVRNGRRSFTVEQITVIARYFKADANWILGLTDVNRKIRLKRL